MCTVIVVLEMTVCVSEKEVGRANHMLHVTSHRTWDNREILSFILSFPILFQQNGLHFYLPFD